MTLPIRIAFAVWMSLAAVVAEAGQVYKWVDRDGRVHFSDTPRPGWTRVDLQSAPAAPTQDAGGEANPRTEPSAGSARDRLRAEECRNRREQLQAYRNAATIIERDALGNEKRYSETERLQLIEQTQKQVAELCGEPVLQ